jgi:tetratricopeptide (TPR) repeat protein
VPAIACLILGTLAAGGEAELSAARRAERAGDFATAEKAYEAALRYRPHAETWQRLGLVRYLQNKFDSAIFPFQEAIRREPARWTAHLFLGICLYRTNQFMAARAALEEARRRAPPGTMGRDDLDFWLGAAYIATKRPLAGLQFLERLLARRPAHSEALELVAQTYADVASALWNAVAERHFDTAPGWQVHGHALESEGNLQAALEAFRQSKALDPRRPGPGLAMGRLLLYQGKAEEARNVLLEELALAPEEPEVSYLAGLAAVQLERYSEAAKFIEAAARRRPQNSEILLALAQVFLAVQEIPKAVQTARRAVELAPFSLAAHEVLLTALTQAGQTEEAELERRRWQARSAQ